MAKTNLFDKAKKSAPATKAKKEEKTKVVVAGKEFDSNLVTFTKLDKEIKEKTAEMNIAKESVKNVGKSEWIKLYETLKRNPESFNLVSESGASVMMLASDKYLKADETRVSELTEKYGEGIVKENTVFSFNPDLLQKYGDVISKLIESCTEISDEDKENLIVAETAYEVAKGSIDGAITTGKGKVEEYIDDIKPIFSLKTRAQFIVFH